MLRPVQGSSPARPMLMFRAVAATMMANSLETMAPEVIVAHTVGIKNIQLSPHSNSLSRIRIASDLHTSSPFPFPIFVGIRGGRGVALESSATCFRL